MSTIKDGGPAFPVSWSIDGEIVAVPGMNLRDFFAASVMQGFCAGSFWAECAVDEAASEAYKAADAMLRAREVQS